VFFPLLDLDTNFTLITQILIFSCYLLENVRVLSVNSPDVISVLRKT
jgi:hypothetical protein